MPTIRTDAFDGCHSRSLDARATIISHVVFSHKNFDGCQAKKA